MTHQRSKIKKKKKKKKKKNCDTNWITLEVREKRKC